LWPRRKAITSPDPETPDGSAQALDQVANWVRFADTKATVLAAGLGVAITMLANNSSTILKAMQQTWISGLIVGGLGAIALMAFLWTLFWLIRAIGPQRKVGYIQPNRFSWPSLARATMADLKKHRSGSSVSEDAWQQIIDLAKLADRKFTACEKAVYGFGALILLGFSCVTVSAVLTP
jgi:hypothetical protein